MEKLSIYRKHLEAVLQKHFHPGAPDSEVEEQLVIDRERDHYQLLQIGWRMGEEPVYFSVIHLDIKAGKIWIQRDFTEVGVANELLERGVPKEDIVLAFHAPYKRPYTDFAVG